ncbi:type II secretion system protein G (GspG) [Nitrosomonas cryotolerans]|uniref:Type II secretion system protein G (GspG) n=1 Tax=Nitrosomonas cryotolerans ATCC 49181 TaxID=1131553 RepID=A0A1N6G596_9PROT|nr:prepilin-type N-terminal cleavage/methylation domain-containing protein [Nitrosomonas cryotolerans]SFP52247.1 type II secretion system protein G (GspG) [Nitrosomonas cryotolerans]SIO02631.1 type II secretion system protein G (GspG) [Nitrosomonas cryotolerans ATCC 49181]
MYKFRSHIGFTLIELLVVMAIIATLLSIVTPRYFSSIEKAKETVLRQDLGIMRDAIDQFYSDTGGYPLSLEELVERRYLRRVPIDPLTESDMTWIEVPPLNEEEEGVYDVHSGYTGQALDGTYYEEW